MTTDGVVCLSDSSSWSESGLRGNNLRLIHAASIAQLFVGHYTRSSKDASSCGAWALPALQPVRAGKRRSGYHYPVVRCRQPLCRGNRGNSCKLLCCRPPRPDAVERGDQDRIPAVPRRDVDGGSPRGRGVSKTFQGRDWPSPFAVALAFQPTRGADSAWLIVGRPIIS
jgi:hypothetical protein